MTNVNFDDSKNKKTVLVEKRFIFPHHQALFWYEAARKYQA